MFLAIPLVSILIYIPAFLTASLYQVRLLSFLCASSLLATAYMLVFIPTKKVGAINRSLQSLEAFSPERPIHKFIPYLNGILGLLLAVNALSWRGRSGVHGEFWILCLLPTIIFSISVAARRIMLDVDVGELEHLKYGYKGA